MSFQIGTAVFDGKNTTGGGSGGGTDLSALITLWQTRTCEDVAVGDPVQALQVVTVNKVQSAICNPETIIGTYDTATRTVLTAGQNLNIPPQSYHSIAFKVISGSGSVALDGGAPQAIEPGEADQFTASRLIQTEFDFVCTTGKIVITTIGEAPPA